MTRKTILFLIKFFLVPLFFLTGWQLFGQRNGRITVEGTTTFESGEELRIVVYEDYISMRQSTIASGGIGGKGSFKFSFNAPQIKLAQIEARTSGAEFFVVPGYHYVFEITMDPQLFELLDPEMYGGFLQVRSNGTDTLDLNYKVNRFNAFYNRVMNYYQYDLLMQKDLNVYDSLMLDLNNRFEIRYEPNNFYLSYLFYTVGAIDMLFYAKKPDFLFERYLDHEYILYDNPAYMAFFKDFYNQFIYNNSDISKSILREHINVKPDYLRLFNELGKHKYLQNERIRELVIIYNLYQFSGHDEFDQQNLLELLNYIKENSHFPEHREITDNVIYMLSKYDTKIVIPTVDLKKEDGNSLKLDRFAGKWVYLHFFNLNCLDCIREMVIIKELQEKFKNEIEFVSVCLDHNFSKFRAFRKDYSMFDWEFVHFNANYDWLRELEIVSLPDNILLDDKGVIYKRYAPDPSRDLTLLLMTLFKDKESENSTFDR